MMITILIMCLRRLLTIRKLFLLCLANSMSERYIEICTTPTTTTADNNDDKDDNDDGVYRQYYCQT